MKNKIKKRVENSRKNASGLVFLWTIFFILLIACGVLYLNQEKLIEYFSKNRVTDKADKDKNADEGKVEKMISVDIDSPNVQHLFNLVHRGKTFADSVIYTNKKLTVAEMTDLYKFDLASNLYDSAAVKNNNAQLNEITAYIEEEDVKHYYELLFGKGTYKAIDMIPYSCTSMNYDTVHRRYVTTNQVCGSIQAFSAYEKIIDAKRNDKTLFITGAVMFTEGYSGSVCKDYDCKTIVDNYPSNIYDLEYFYNYIDKNSDKLMHYTYKFKLGDDGFYYYQGFERTKE